MVGYSVLSICIISVTNLVILQSMCKSVAENVEQVSMVQSTGDY